jgi:hypothetical protein
MNISTRKVWVAALCVGAVLFGDAATAESTGAFPGYITGVVQGEKVRRPESGLSPRRGVCRRISSRSL